MRFVKPMVAFILLFCILAVTVVCSAVAVDDTTATPSQIAPKKDTDIAPQAASEYSPRLSAPSKSNKYYYSDMNIFYKTGWGMPNCTCYAWGRAYEILKKKPDLCIYSAYLWYDYNKENKYYAYGKEPKLGAIACWEYRSGTAGHVAVVEKITSTTITYSNSAWGGDNFYLSTTPVNDPAANSDWIFEGFIYIGEYYNGTNAEDEPQGDVYKITSDDGVNIRKGAGTSYSVIGAIPHGVNVTVTKTKVSGGYTWGYTTYNSISGWFVTDFAELIYTKDNESEELPTDDERVDIIGDVDLDNKLTVIDATLMQCFLAQLETPTEYQLALCDVDGDSKFTIIDPTHIQMTLALLI